MQQDTPVLLRRLAASDAAAAARLHQVGQPGTLLTSLGLPFLRVLYVGFAGCSQSYGTVAVHNGQTVGVIVGTDDTSRLFRELIGRQWLRVGVAAAQGVLRHPSLLRMAWRAMRYPSEAEREEGVGELLFIGVDPPERHHGIGTALLEALLQESRARGLRALSVTVDASNATAIRFYEEHGFVYQRTAELYGRPMHFYRLEL